MKPEMKESSEDDSTSMPIKIIAQESSKENVKSILKSSPTRSTTINSNNPVGNLRAAMIARDEKRIQFNIQEDSKNIVITSEEDEASSSAAIDEIKPKRDFMGQYIDKIFE